ncbi:MAG: ATP-binding protein [Candidatus Hodarchaeales archaeon]
MTQSNNQTKKDDVKSERTGIALGQLTADQEATTVKKYMGEIIGAQVSSGLTIKMKEDSEEVKIGDPLVIEGKKYDYFCIVRDIVFPRNPTVEMLANADYFKSSFSIDMMETSKGKAFSPVAELNCVQMIERSTKKPLKFETIPPYFSKARKSLATDAETIYGKGEKTLDVGTLRGIDDFPVVIDFEKIVELPFGIFGRTGSGKTFLNKIILGNTLHSEVAQVLVFDMQSEYGWRSRSDNSPGLKFFFEDEVQVFALDKDLSSNADRMLVIDESEIEPEDLVIAFSDLTEAMIDTIYDVDGYRSTAKTPQTLIEAINNADSDVWDKLNKGSLKAVQRRIRRLNRFEFIAKSGKSSLDQILAAINNGYSIVIDFGKYGTDMVSYLFVANLIVRRLYDIYSKTDTRQTSSLPQLLVLLEEAHKFLAPAISKYTIFSNLAREMRKFGLVLAMVDQRPSTIDDEILSQLANRFILSMNDPRDVESALKGPVNPSDWRKIVAALPPRQALAFGDAISVATTLEVAYYSEATMSEKWQKNSARKEVKQKIEKMDVKDLDNMFDD